jgi:hypothetical protein
MISAAPVPNPRTATTDRMAGWNRMSTIVFLTILPIVSVVFGSSGVGA